MKCCLTLLILIAFVSRGYCEQLPIEGLVQSGDIICRYGDGFWSSRFRESSVGDKRFSHVGIIQVKSGDRFVIHALASDFSGAGSVLKEPLTDFLSDSHTVSVYRFKGPRAVRSKIADEAVLHIGKPFDLAFDLDSDESLYCSELVWICVNAALGKKLIESSILNGKRIIPIDSCYSCGEMKCVFDSDRE